jgi:outer membrane lipoprotein carrier protein
LNKLLAIWILLSASLLGEQWDLNPLKTWLEAQAEVRSVEANFIQKRKLATLDREIETEGKLWVNYPDRFHWQMGEPARALIIRNGDKMQFYNKQTDQLSSFGVTSDEGRRYAFMTSSFATSLEEFQKGFEIKKVWEEDGVYYVLFQSKNSTLQKRVPFLALGIYRKSNKLGLFEMHLEDKSIIRTTFTNYQINGAVPEEKFRLMEN